MSPPVRFPALADADWLHARFVDDGFTRVEIAAMLGCSDVLVGNAIRRHGISRLPGWRRPSHRASFSFDFGDPVPERHGEDEPEREFVPIYSGTAGLDPRCRTAAHVDVADDELQRRLTEGLRDLATLAALADGTSRDALWDLLVSQVEPAAARAVCFTAAVLAAKQALRVNPSALTDRLPTP